MPLPGFCAGRNTNTACTVGQHDSTGGAQPRAPSILSASASHPRGATPPLWQISCLSMTAPPTVFSRCAEIHNDKREIANDRPLAKMREKIWGNGRKTKCRTNYPINAQLSPCGLMVCVGFGNSSTRLRRLLNSLSAVVHSRQTHTLSRWNGPIVGYYVSIITQ